MIYFFLISLGLLLLSLVVSLVVKKAPRMQAAVLSVLGAVSAFALLGLLFTRFFGGRIEFMHPWAFVLLLVVLAVFLGQTLFKKSFSRQINYPFSHLIIHQASLRVLFTRWVPMFCYLAALSLMILALARPVKIDRTLLPPTEGIDIILLLDVSASMQKQDFYPNRFVAAQNTASRFIAKRPTDRMGLVAFAKEAMLHAPLTLDHEALQEYISTLYLGIIDANNTAIGDALGVAANHLKNSKAKSKIIILLTDGDSNAGAIDPSMAAKAAAAYGIRVYTIGTASAPGENPYSSQEDEINEGLMLEIAQETGGKFYRAKNETELEQIYNTINQLEKTEFSPSSIISRTDFYQPLLLLAVVMLFAGLIAEKILFIKVP